MEFLRDYWWWIVAAALILGFALSFLYPRLPAVLSRSETERVVVVVHAANYQEAIEQLKPAYLDKGWYVAAWDYDDKKQTFVFVLRK